MLDFYAQKIDTLQEPFLAFTFTSSTHPPFVSPGKKWEKYPHDAKSIYGFFNTLFYADEALGRFMEHAKKQSWYEKTVFVFLADHTLGYGSDSEMSKGLAPQNKERALENMRIPLVIYAPKIFPQARTISSIGSQADIFPTLASFLGWKGSVSTLGNSLFSDSRKDFALFRNGNILGYVTQQGYIKHTLQQELENTIGKDANKDMLSIYQSINQLLLENKFAEKDTF
jgi:phosphoglycerol transferase MdoB-like AlkP superfamily enzyme